LPKKPILSKRSVSAAANFHTVSSCRKYDHALLLSTAATKVAETSGEVKLHVFFVHRDYLRNAKCVSDR
jgi:hypothetical protein